MGGGGKGGGGELIGGGGGGGGDAAGSTAAPAATHTPATQLMPLPPAHPYKYCPAVSQSGSGTPHEQSHPSNWL